jgi:magnesium transporter
MPIRTIKEKMLTWYHIDQVDQEATAFLRSNFSFHQLDFEDLLQENLVPKIDIYKNYLFLIIQFPHWNAILETVETHEVDLFIGDNFLITIENTKSKEMKNFFYRCMKNRRVRAEWMSGSAGLLLYNIMQAMFAETQPILNTMGKRITQLENDIFIGTFEHAATVVRELGLHRRNIMTIRRMIEPQRFIITTLGHTDKSYIDSALSIYFDNINDYLNKLWSLVGTYKDTLDGLSLAVESLISRRINKVISALTVISVALLPLNLLAGIYGMNIDNLPYAHNPAGVWIMFAIFSCIIIGAIYIMRRKRYL